MASSESGKRSCRRRPSDLYGGIATVTESGLPISPTSEWDLKQRRVWPPALCQAYCENHFLHECLVYYSLEMEKIEDDDEKRKRSVENQATEPGKASSAGGTSKAALPQPRRIQPGRRAKGSSSTSAQAESSSRNRTYQEFIDDEYEKMERRQELCLDIPWAKFQGKLESLIKRTNKKLYRQEEKKGSPHATGASQTRKRKKNKASAEELEQEEQKQSLDQANCCPFQGPFRVGCRYCDQRPEIGRDADNLGNPPPSRGAPVAPMHILRADDFGPDQICTFGGLTFAVDVCGGTDSVTVVLIEMRGALDQEAEPEGDGEGGKRGDHESSTANELPPNKRAKLGRRREDDTDLNWIPEEDTD
ncbi:hypothetical protein PG995_016315 [Apiospora arundinis]